MTVRLAEDGTIMLEGTCPVADAELLARLLLSDPDAEVDWCACEQSHTAVVQVLLASHRSVRGPPQALFLRNWVEPLLAGVVEPMASIAGRELP
jgi:hypothetical protein